MQTVIFIHSQAKSPSDRDLMVLVNNVLPTHIDIMRGRIDVVKSKYYLIKVCNDRRSPRYHQDREVLSYNFPKAIVEYAHGPFLLTKNAFTKILYAEEHDEILEPYVLKSNSEAEATVLDMVRSGEMYAGTPEIKEFIQAFQRNKGPSFLYQS